MKTQVIIKQPTSTVAWLNWKSGLSDSEEVNGCNFGHAETEGDGCEDIVLKNTEVCLEWESVRFLMQKCPFNLSS